MAVVLIVEDEEQVRVWAEAIIRELGHETLTAGTAEQALAVVEERSDVDLLFTDIGLQQNSEAGLQLARDVAGRRPALPVLYTTGQGVTDGMRAMFAEPFGFVPKPYTPDDLKTALSNLIHKACVPRFGHIRSRQRNLFGRSIRAQGRGGSRVRANSPCARRMESSRCYFPTLVKRVPPPR